MTIQIFAASALVQGASMDFKPPGNAFKGRGPITILALLKDDEADREMGRMTDLLQSRIEKSNRKTARIDCSVSLAGCQLGGSTVYVTGHSRFMEASTKIRPMANRTLGGFPLDAVVEVLFNGICNGVTEIEFWCCESACKRETAHYKGNSDGTVCQTFSCKALETLCMKFEAESWGEISTLDYVCGKLVELAQKQSLISKRPLESYPNVCLTALNGVGYISEEDDYITTFDQGAMLAEYNSILKMEKDIREKRSGTHTAKNLKQAEGRLKKHIATRSCHFITIELNFLGFVAEAKGLSSFLHRQKKQRAMPPRNRIPVNTLQQMDQMLGPVLRKQ
ncbi:hypothetical protein WKW79_33635 [Variovorax robiniae]|uniref:Uncharacterized protein n=1 Tax=Variovorax robiniae TaxID=1836199 RepID=A0ABU8XIP4_9BURK